MYGSRSISSMLARVTADDRSKWQRQRDRRQHQVPGHIRGVRQPDDGSRTELIPPTGNTPSFTAATE